MRQQLGLAPTNPPDGLRLQDAATPSGKVGLAAIAGSGNQWMRANAAPALDLTIAPTWTGLHAFNAGLTATTGTFSGQISAPTLGIQAAAGQANTIATGPCIELAAGGTSSLTEFQNSGGQTELWQYSASLGWVQIFKVLASTALTFNTPISVLGLSALQAVTATGLVATAANSSQPASFTFSDPANSAGIGLHLIGNGSTTPSKYIRVNGGLLQVVNDAYTAVILGLTDAGALTIPGAFTSGSITSAGTGTWSGAHTWTVAGSSTGILINSNGAQPGLLINNNSTGHGLEIDCSSTGTGLWVNGGGSAPAITVPYGLTSLQSTIATNLSVTGTGSLMQVASTKYAWNSMEYAIDVGTGGAVRADTGSTIALDSNLYYNTAGTPAWIYKSGTSGTPVAGADFSIAGGAFSWNTAPAGIAGNTATLTPVMTLSNAGVLSPTSISVTVPTAGYGIACANTGANPGLYGSSSGAGAAIYGYCTGAGIGVQAASISTGPALNAANTTGGVAITVGTGGVVIGSATGGNKGTGTVNAVTVYAQGVALTSDLRVKKNLTPITHALDFIQGLHGVRFDWKENGGSSVGLIAQDVEGTYPELVEGRGEEMKSLNYNGIIAILLEAVKEQQIQIQELQRKAA